MSEQGEDEKHIQRNCQSFLRDEKELTEKVSVRMGGVRMKEIIKETILGVFTEKGIEIDSIVLFGSRARGDATKHSDWDFLIVTKNDLTLSQKREIAKTIRVKLAEMYIPCDVIIKTQKELEYYKDFIGTVTREALKEGVEI